MKEETKIKLSNALRLAYKEGRRLPSMLGKHHTEETKMKIRVANRGNTYCIGHKLSEEHKRKISLGISKYTKTYEHCKNLSKSKLGKVLSEEHRKHISDTHRRLGIKPPSRKGTIPWNYEGRTTLTDQIRKCSKYNKWRLAVFIRDNFTCVQCNKNGCKLHADHIKKFSIILNEYKIKTFEEALSCIELWNINNGRTLCIPCHKKTETYGKGNFMYRVYTIVN